MDASGLIKAIAEKILNPTIGLLFGAAILIFVWGIMGYIRGADQSGEREKGAKHMMWGLIGIFIMIAAYKILEAFVNSVYGG
jgi:hypothetical protein